MKWESRSFIQEFSNAASTMLVCVWGGDQAYSRLSTTHGHITDCKLDSVVHAGVCVVI